MNKMISFNIIRIFATTLIIFNLAAYQSQQQQYNDNQNVGSLFAKSASFKEPGTGYAYRVSSYNDTKYGTSIKVERVKINEAEQPIEATRPIQTIPIKSLVDFDLNCGPSHCYLVTLSRKSKSNVGLYAWTQTQFDEVESVTSFAPPHSVKLFQIRPNEFYIAIAQDQLHLPSSRINLNDQDEHIKFFGCVILKFTRGNPKIKYHQVIKLPFNPYYVTHYTSNIQNEYAPGIKQTDNHYLVFSIDGNLNPTSNQARSFIWSSLNDYFWPYQVPQSTVVVQPSTKHGFHYPTLKFPNHIQQVNQTTQTVVDWNQPVEACFSHLQRLISDRSAQARQIIQSSRSLWYRKNSNEQNKDDLTNIKSRVIVHGDVYVKGFMVQSPQLTLFGRDRPKVDLNLNTIINMIDSHSPVIVERKLAEANSKLKTIMNKLRQAVNILALGELNEINFNSMIEFRGNLMAKKVFFANEGIVNSNVKLNGIQYAQLEHELIGLRGAQEIPAKVVFKGKVLADLLEITGKINGHYLLKDAVDINSPSMQIINLSNLNYNGTTSIGLEFNSVAAKNIVLTYDATINNIRLNEFITRDNTTQHIIGQKRFKNLSMRNLNMNGPNVLLNERNITRMANNAIRLQMPHNHTQVFYGEKLTFAKSVTVGRLFINNLVNHFINVSNIIHDSVKANDMSIQQITGHKQFLNGVRINQLDIEGAINNIQIDQVFNLNAAPPIGRDYIRNQNSSHLNRIDGNFDIDSTLYVTNNLNAGLINNVNITKHAVRRYPSRDAPIQYISGKKIFFKPVRVLSRVQLLNPPNRNTTYKWPTVNGLDLKSISAGIRRQKERPALINIGLLEIDGNINLPTMPINSNDSSRATLGSHLECPLDFIKTSKLMTGNLNQVINAPVRLRALRAESIRLDDPFALNNINFPNDFVLRTSKNADYNSVEPIFGHKYIDHLRIAKGNPYMTRAPTNIVFGSNSVINNVTYDKLQAFIMHERQKNSTGETVIQVMNIYGRVFAKRINGLSWPDDILLKSYAGNPLADPMAIHKRIYSPLIFTEPDSFLVEDQLVLRGPVHLDGLLNGYNLTEFAKSSVTYGDKDLFSPGRPIINKNFAGGISVRGEFRSQGFIDGIDFDQMKNRVVLTNHEPSSRHNVITAGKSFMSDVVFEGPVRMRYVNDMLIDNYLKHIRVGPNNIVPIFGKKTITGTLKINSNLIVQGLVNKLDFLDLHAKAISITNPQDLHFKGPFTIDQDAFINNLQIDEKNGTLDGIKLADVARIPKPMAIIKQQLYYPPAKIMGGEAISMRFDFPIVNQPHAVTLYKVNMNNHQIQTELQMLRKKIISLSLLKSQRPSKLVIGFIPSLNNDVSNFIMAEQDPPHSGHSEHVKYSRTLAQLDFPFLTTQYHLAVDVSNPAGRNVTSVNYSVGGGESRQFSELPIDSPNSALFVKVADERSVFLIISQDHTTISEIQGAQCPKHWTNFEGLHSYTGQLNGLTDPYSSYHYLQPEQSESVLGNIHVYLFHTLQNSSSLSNAYFDMYQTINVPGIDGFEKFNYEGSTYIIAISRHFARIYLMVLRGYSGFQVVSHIDAPGVEDVRVLYTLDRRPMLLIKQSNGLHRVMESVII